MSRVADSNTELDILDILIILFFLMLELDLPFDNFVFISGENASWCLGVYL